MKSPGFAQQVSLSKVFVLLFPLIFAILIGSCTQNQSPDQVAELPSDQEITETLKTQVDAATGIPADSISIQTRDGIVTLSGNTTNLLAKKESNKIAQSTYGVLTVVNNLKITASRPDSAIDRDVDRALSTDPATESWEINSSVNNGTVTLKGSVGSWQERQLAETIASRVKGVRHINNNIGVHYEETRTDEEIRAEVERTIQMDSRVDGNMVNVAVNDGEVTLSGAISSAYEKELSQNLAHVTGVETVHADKLEVHPEYESGMYQNGQIEALTASQIKQAINDAFRYDPRVPSEKISVTVDGNTAILEGTVLNLNSKRAAGSDAMNTTGISNVQNNIEVQRKVVVQPDVPTTDKALAERLRYAIIRDPYVEKAPINVQVDNGIAVISGEVDSQFEKEQIDQIAANVKGIIAVNNEITVPSGS